MSKENVEVVREIYDAVARRDTETVLALYDPEVEWDFSGSPYKNVTGRDRYHFNGPCERTGRRGPPPPSPAAG
jgi:ketosteroid isomerase-like protein